MKALAYPVNIIQDEDGRFVATFPDFGWGATDGATEKEAIEEASDCLAEIIATTISEGRDLPEPSAPIKGQNVIHPTAEIAAKAMLAIAMKEKKFKTIELARCLNVNEKEARRILDPHHKTKLPRMEKALRAVGLRMVIGFEEDEDQKHSACA
jgi:antitoxin HicB